VSQVVWAEIMVSTYAEGVSGVDIVLQTGDQAYTYTVFQGVATLKGEGDLHDTNFDSFAVQLEVTPQNLFGPTSARYVITLYPTQELYDVYSTRNPMLATVGAVCIIAFTSLLFLLYDLFVRRDLNAKKELLEAKRAFVRFVSHEVRTPLNSVCMGLTLMKEEIAANLNTNNDEHIDNLRSWLTLTDEVTENAHSAVDVLNDVLNYDKVETGKLTLEYTIVPIFDLIEQTVSEFKLPAMKKNIKLIVQTPKSKDIEGHTDGSLELYVVGDKVRLTQVFRNLVSNAIKFTPEQGDLTVRATWLPPTDKQLGNPTETSFTLPHEETVVFTQNGSLILTVTDTGVGMTPEQIKSVFRPGAQFNVNELQAGNGSGLGTYIAKRIVRQHGGSLSGASDGLHKGSAFSVTLPVHDIPSDLTPTTKTVDADSDDDYSGPLKILVVDDAKMNLKLLMRLLSKHGHIVDGAEDGQIAVDKVKAAMEAGDQFDAVLMDHQMPIMNGPTASRKMREMGCDAFIVGVTGNVMPDDVRFFKNAGANAVLPKPIKLSELEALWVEHDIRGDGDDDVEDSQMQFQMGLSQMEGIFPPPVDTNRCCRLSLSTTIKFQEVETTHQGVG
jgi:signal transduction histidine kinase/FixJ family two-component response regulator